MNNLRQSLWVETLKARRSKMPLFTALGFLIFPLVLGFFMLVLKNPELARRYWLISAKAQITLGAADWPNYIRFLALSSVMGGFLLFSLIGSWVFGREYSDRTVKDLLALPTGRTSIVLSKFVLVAAWSSALVALNCLVGLGVGAAVGLPPVSGQIIWQGGVTVAIASLLTIALVTPLVAFFASFGHGYLAPLGVALLILFLIQVVVQAGWGEYFPWAVPALYVQGETPGVVSYAIVLLTSLGGVAATILWWELADQTR